MVLAAVSTRPQSSATSGHAAPRAVIDDLVGWERTLDPNMDIILRLFCLPRVFVGFGEGVCKEN